MANNPYVNKVLYGNDTVMDISDTTAEEGDVVSGKTFYKASGAKGTGSAVIPDISNCYETTDTLASTLADNDMIPFYDASENGKRNTTWSNIKAVISNALSTTYARLADLRNVVKDTVGWVAKNVVPLTIDSLKEINTRGTWSGNAYTDRGITYTVTVNTQGYVTQIVANGTATGASALYMLNGTIGSYSDILSNDTYIMNGCPSGGDAIEGFSMQFTIGFDAYILTNTTDISFLFSGSSSSSVYWGIYVANGASVSNKTFKPMLRRTLSNSTFEAYHPTVEEEFEKLGDLAYINKDGVGSTKVLQGDGQWVTPSSGGHTMLPTPDAGVDEDDIVNAIKTGLLEGGTNDDVPSLNTLGTWSNVNSITLLYQLNQGDTGVGTWTDTYETDDDRTGWLWAEDLYQVLKKEVTPGVMQTVSDIEIYPVHDGGENETLSLYAYRVDDDYSRTVDGVSVNGGCVAFKLNSPVQSEHINIGVKILLQRTLIKQLTPIT